MAQATPPRKPFTLEYIALPVQPSCSVTLRTIDRTRFRRYVRCAQSLIHRNESRKTEAFGTNRRISSVTREPTKKVKYGLGGIQKRQAKRTVQTSDAALVQVPK